MKMTVIRVALMMEAVSTSEMSVNFKLTTLRNIPEGTAFNLPRVYSP
jgi:hypothetical protein